MNNRRAAQNRPVSGIRIITGATAVLAGILTEIGGVMIAAGTVPSNTGGRFEAVIMFSLAAAALVASGVRLLGKCRTRDSWHPTAVLGAALLAAAIGVTFRHTAAWMIIDVFIPLMIVALVPVAALSLLAQWESMLARDGAAETAPALR